jgi:hypothetical protein
MRKTLPLLALLSFLALPQSRAGLIAYEGFDTSLGSLTGKSGATSFGWSLPWQEWNGPFEVTAGSLAAPNSVTSFYRYSPIGNSAFGEAFLPSNSNDPSTARGATLSSTTTFPYSILYGSFLADRRGDSASPSASFSFNAIAAPLFASVPIQIPNNQLTN